jgi:two-component system phosphate regulon sensor histidine kinase PhoR
VSTKGGLFPCCFGRSRLRHSKCACTPYPPFRSQDRPSELRSALSNLVSNAVRYTPAGGQIDITAEILSDGRVEFAVTDTGPGIAPEHLPRLSERFYRVDRSRSRESGGTGLGLAIAKHVAQRHDGELIMTSVLGQGSRFALVLPANRFRPAVAEGQGGAMRAP